MSLTPVSYLPSEPEKVYEGIDIAPDLMASLQENVARRLTPKAVKIRSDIEVKCFSYEGIDAIKAALKAGEAVSTEAVPIKIRLVAPPLYVVTTNSTDKSAGVELMEKALTVIDAKIQELGGEMSVKMKVSTAPPGMDPVWVIVAKSTSVGRARADHLLSTPFVPAFAHTFLAHPSPFDATAQGCFGS